MPSDHRCPVCSTDVASSPDLRMHLMVEHRKSELAGALTRDVAEAEQRDERLPA